MSLTRHIPELLGWRRRGHLWLPGMQDFMHTPGRTCGTSDSGSCCGPPPDCTACTETPAMCLKIAIDNGWQVTSPAVNHYCGCQGPTEFYLPYAGGCIWEASYYCTYDDYDHCYYPMHSSFDGCNKLRATVFQQSGNYKLKFQGGYQNYGGFPAAGYPYYLWQADLGTTKPDCKSWSNLSLPFQSQSSNPCDASAIVVTATALDTTGECNHANPPCCHTRCIAWRPGTEPVQLLLTVTGVTNTTCQTCDAFNRDYLCTKEVRWCYSPGQDGGCRYYSSTIPGFVGCRSGVAGGVYSGFNSSTHQYFLNPSVGWATTTDTCRGCSGGWIVHSDEPFDGSNLDVSMPLSGCFCVIGNAPHGCDWTNAIMRVRSVAA